MINITIKIDSKQYEQFLKEMPDRMASALDRSIKKIAFLIEGFSKQVTPVDTGRLRSSIHTVTGDLRASVGTNVDYAVFVHDGTKRMGGRPFMRQGLEQAEGEIEGIVSDEVERALKD